MDWVWNKVCKLINDPVDFLLETEQKNQANYKFGLVSLLAWLEVARFMRFRSV